MKSFWILLLILVPFLSKADTLDHWSIYKNDSLVAEMNSVSELFEMTIDKKNLSDLDVISILYRNDHPCTSCEYYFALKGGEGIKLHVNRRRSFKEKVTFPLNKLTKYPELKEYEIMLFINHFGKAENEHIVFMKIKVD